MVHCAVIAGAMFAPTFTAPRDADQRFLEVLRVGPERGADTKLVTRENANSRPSAEEGGNNHL
jgi:hypothetical protein